MTNPFLACLYSILLPGLGQLAVGERVKGLTFLCMDAGVVVSLIVSHTAISCFVMGGIYLAILIPAASDAFRTASGRPHVFTGDTVPYVITMLLMVGPFAIPLLWQSSRFSIRAKILWTVLVFLIVFLAMAVVTSVASFFSQFLKQGAAS